MGLCSSYYIQGYKTKAKVVDPDISAGSSTIHVIDKVLVPKLARRRRRHLLS